MRMRVLVATATVLMVVAPHGARAEAFSTYWSSLADDERDFVDHLAAGLYREEKGERADNYSALNIASKARYRARAVEALGVKNQPKRSNKRGAEI